jgi:hypothetical protein
MIVEWFVTFVLNIVGAFVSLFPVGAVTIPTFGPLVGLVREVDTVLPVHEALTAMLGLYGLAGAVYGFRLLLQIKRHVPFIGGG